MTTDARHHVVYEVIGSIDELSKIERSELLDKKVVDKPTDDVTLDLKGKTLYEELELYLNHIKVQDVDTVLNEFKDLRTLLVALDFHSIVYWEYIQNKHWMRPDKYKNSNTSSMHWSACTDNPYFRRGKSFKQDLESLIEQFHKRYGKKYNYVLTLSGGIDSEVTAEAFYQMGIPFRTISQRLLGGINDHDLKWANDWLKTRKVDHEVLNYQKNSF